MMYIFYGLDPKTAERIEKAQFTPPDNWSGDYQDVKAILDTEHKWSMLNGERFDFNNTKHIKMLPDIINGVYVWCEKSKRKIVITKGGPGSGHFGHAGRPGKVGGSAPSKGKGKAAKPKKKVEAAPAKPSTSFEGQAKSGKYKDKRMLSQGIQAHTKLVEMEDGTLAVEKVYFDLPEEDYNYKELALNDVVSYEIAEALGMDNVPEAIITSDDTSIQKFMDDSPTIAKFLKDEPDVMDTVNPRQLESLLYYDIMIGNRDRHLNNVLINASTSDLVFIDNSLSLTVQLDADLSRGEYERMVKYTYVKLRSSSLVPTITKSGWKSFYSKAQNPKMRSIMTNAYGSDIGGMVHDAAMMRLDVFDELYAAELED